MMILTSEIKFKRYTIRQKRPELDIKNANLLNRKYQWRGPAGRFGQIENIKDSPNFIGIL